eukprot:gene362-6776_t
MSFLDRIEEFYQPNKKLNNEVKNYLKTLYDLNLYKNELFVKDFEEEQIWSQIQNLNELLNLKIFDDKKLNLLDETQMENFEEKDFEDYEEMEKDDEDDEDDKEEEELEEEEEEEEEEDINDFINKMEDYLDEQEENEEDLEEQVDIEMYGDEEIEKEEEKYKKKNVRFAEDIKGGDDDDDDLDAALDEKLKEIGNDEELDGSSEDEGYFKQRKVKEKKKRKTKFEIEQEEMIESMEELENKNIEKKKWQMSGEVSSNFRPQNSLLEEDVDFKHTSKVKPIITEEITQNLEEIILNRIINNIFDDPEKPDLNEEKKKKRKEVSREKNEKSLSELYEENYLKKNNLFVEKDEENPDVLEKKLKVKSKVEKCLHMLNVLSNLNYIPEPIERDLNTNVSIEQSNLKSNELIDKTPQEIMKPIRNIKEKLKTSSSNKKKDEKKKSQKDLLEREKKKLDFSKSKEFFKLMEEKK